MIQVKNKHKLLTVIILTAIVIALLLINSFVIDSSNENGENLPPTLTSEGLKQTIPAHIDSILFTFGIDKDWIKNINPQTDTVEEKAKFDEKYKSAWLVKKVFVPRDLALSDLNYELTNYLNELKLKTQTFENAKTGALSLEVYNPNGDTEVVEAVILMDHNDSLEREASEVALILTNTEKYELSDLKLMLDSPERFSLVLPIDYKYSDIQSAILESGNDYILMYSIGLEDDFSADFRDKMPEKEWMSKVKSISVAFPKAAAVIFTNPEKLYKYEKAVREHFLEYRPDVYRDTIYTDIMNSDLQGGVVDRLYTSILNNTKAGKKYQLYIAEFTPEDFEYYTKRIYELKKKGYKFVYLSRVLKHLKKESASKSSNGSDTLNLKKK